MGSIKQRGEQSYLLTVELGYDTKGKRVQRYKTVKITDDSLLRTTKRLKEHLETELKKFEMEVRAGVYIAPEKLSFEAFALEYEKKFVDPDLEDKTQDNYKYHLKRRIIPYFKHMRLDQIKPMHIIEYLAYLKTPAARLDGSDKPLGSATIVYNYRILRSLFTKALEWQVLKKSPMEGVKKPKEDDKREMEVYDEDGIAAMFEALEHEPLQLRILIMLAVMGGLRRGEIAGIEWTHMDFEKKTFEIKQTIPKLKDGKPVIKGPKNKNSVRKLAIPASLVSELMEYRDHWRREKFKAINLWEEQEHEFLFCNINGSAIDPQTLTDRWISFHRRHKLKPIRLHDLRHTAATWMISKNMHAKAIAKRLGHSKIKTTMDVYGHVFDSVDQAAASVLDDMVPEKLKKSST